MAPLRWDWRVGISDGENRVLLQRYWKKNILHGLNTCTLKPQQIFRLIICWNCRFVLRSSIWCVCKSAEKKENQCVEFKSPYMGFHVHYSRYETQCTLFFIQHSLVSWQHTGHQQCISDSHAPMSISARLYVLIPPELFRLWNSSCGNVSGQKII